MLGSWMGGYGGCAFQGLALVYIDILILAVVDESPRLEDLGGCVEGEGRRVQGFFSERSGAMFTGQYWPGRRSGVKSPTIWAFDRVGVMRVSTHSTERCPL